MTFVRLFNNGAEVFPAMFEAIGRAQSSVALEMYTVADDKTGRMFRDCLVAAARRDVQVMVLVDAWGSWELNDTFWAGLREAGGLVRWFHPIGRGLLPFRNHRKLLLIDDNVAFIGGMNIADEYYHGTGGRPPWRDNVLLIKGMELAWLRLSFKRMWARAELRFLKLRHLFRRERGGRGIIHGSIRFLESGPEDPARPVRKAYRQVVKSALKSIDLAMGYFYPHGRMIRTLKRAVRRGVRVRLLIPQKTDVPIARWAARGLYGRLLRAGIEVWEYLPTMMHAKLAIADNTLIVGSANLDIRSGRINYELVAVVSDPGLAAGARADFEQDLRHAVRIRFEDWKKRPLIQKLKERFSFWMLARADIFVARMGIAGKIRKRKKAYAQRNTGEE
jgi:cardiolipin synthase